MVLLVFSFLSAQAGQIHLDCPAMVALALSKDPRVAEEAYPSEAKRNRIEQIKMDAILPKASVYFAVGPTPGLSEYVQSGDTISRWDFSKIGPYMGTKIEVAQPLNLGQYHTGIKAAKADLAQTEWDIQAKRVERAQEYQQYYYGYLLALESCRLSKEAARQMQKAEDRIDSLLDEDDEKTSQDDLLQIKAGRYEVDKAVSQAENGLRKANLAIHFALQLADQDTFVPAETLLVQREDAIPPLDTLKSWLRVANPELKRLENGLVAKTTLVELEEDKLGPEFFIFGSFKFAKSWAMDRENLSQNALVRDPVNTLTGSLGLGMRFNLNIWSDKEKIRKTRIDLRQLKLKEAYALKGLQMLLEQQYNDWIMARDNLESARSSLRASEALLKGAAMRFDVDPSEGSKLVDAYKRNILMQKDYYFAVYQYNIAVAGLLAKVGLELAIFPRS